MAGSTGDGTSKERFKIKCLEQYGSIGRNYGTNLIFQVLKSEKKKRRFLLLNLGACSFEGRVL